VADLLPVRMDRVSTSRVLAWRAPALALRSGRWHDSLFGLSVGQYDDGKDHLFNAVDSALASVPRAMVCTAAAVLCAKPHWSPIAALLRCLLLRAFKDYSTFRGISGPRDFFFLTAPATWYSVIAWQVRPRTSGLVSTRLQAPLPPKLTVNVKSI